jgi:cytochrome c-type biogenesis protein CcmH
MPRLLPLLLLAWLVPAVATQVQEDPLDRQVLEIAKDLRCAVCQNQPVAESNSDLARDMRAIIREQLIAGRSREEIVKYFVDRYGDYVLMKPPVERAGTLLWALPAILLVILVASGFVFLTQRRRETAAPAPTLSAEDAARVKAAREQQR